MYQFPGTGLSPPRKFYPVVNTLLYYWGLFEFIKNFILWATLYHTSSNLVKTPYRNCSLDMSHLPSLRGRS